MPSLLAVAKDSSTDKSDVRSIFEIDGQEMYIPSQGVDSEYFVVL